ncbi:hypothetical protein [Aquitalea sp. LB_tupeE]|uniref:hypothetical protein n=1 Tax=Aquitalea sp. LB_tupeE TaxID=2748078 RepID=UPI0015BABC08|nr:hypothetical protein [Aquitalea sp. LB_tupeE]NWK77923.1 hypothetical protein [Aquitalea sp. LB_tupeE]
MLPYRLDAVVLQTIANQGDLGPAEIRGRAVLNKLEMRIVDLPILSQPLPYKAQGQFGR